MKNRAATLALLALGLSVSAQQDDSRDQFNIGIKGGFNYANVYDTRGEDFTADPRFGLAAGGFLSIPLTTFIGLQPEILFSQKGYQGTGTFLGFDYSYSRTMSYLDIPINFALKPTKNISLFFGPQYSFLLTQRDEFNSSLMSYDMEEEFENDNIRKNTLGISTGLDLNFSSAVIGLRASWDLQDNKGDGTSSVPNYKNTLVQATIGFRF